MRIVLRLSGEADVEGGTLKTVTLGDRDFYIGRDPDCDWTVSDTLRMMSRRHCSLKKEGDGVLLTDLSSNGTSLGSPGNRLVQGQPTPLPDTAIIYLGGEHVRVDYEYQRAEKPQETPDDDDFWGVQEIKRARGQSAERRLPDDDSLDLFGDEAPDRDDPLSLTLDAAPEKSAMNDMLSLDDAPPARPPEPEPRPREPDTATFATKTESTGSEDLFALDDSSDDDDPFADLSRKAAAPAKADSLTLEEAPPNRAVQEKPAAPVSDPPVSREETQQSRGHPKTIFPADAATPPAPQAPSQTTSPPANTPTARPQPGEPSGTAGQSADAERAIAALFASLGISLDEVPPEKRHEMAAEIGRSFRALADGMRELLASRRDVKIALGLGATQIETGSNPLKFCRDANDAVNALLRPTATGFLTGSTAVSDAVTALQQHQVALVGGVKASMKTALGAFNPSEIEDKLAKKGLSQIIPMKRKAELWEQFVLNYKDFAAEADEDIRRVIGKQLEKLYADEAVRSRAALNL